MAKRALSILLVLLCASCAKPGPRRPLFGGGAPEPELAGPVEVPPPRAHRPTDGEKLLARLRASDPAVREQIVRELLAQGGDALPTIERALAEERLILDVLGEAQRQLSPEQAPAPPSAAEPGRLPPTDWVQTKYRLALDRFLAGDTFGAIQVVDAIVALEPDTALRPKLRRLRRGCEARLLRESVLAADLVTSTPTVLAGESPKLKVRLKNLSADVIELRLDEGRRLGTVNVDYEVLSPDGTRTRTRTQRPVRAKARVVSLPPGRVTYLPVRLLLPDRPLPEGKVGRYHFGGRLRAHTMLVGDAPYTMFVPLFATDVVVLTKADSPLAEDPVQAFAEAALDASQGPLADRLEPARRVFVAAILMARDQREAALERLATALEDATGPLSDAICSALARVTGEPLSFTRQEWLIWWKGRRSRPSRDSTGESQ